MDRVLLEIQAGMQPTTHVTDWLIVTVAAYAAIVSTAALALEIRRWLESGPRISINLMAKAKAFGLPTMEDNAYLVCNVTNQGNLPTTITHFCLCDYENLLNWLIGKAPYQVIVPKPEPEGQPPAIPKLLNPGELWTGIAKYDEAGELEKRIRNGYTYVLIYSNHCKKPTSKHIFIRDVDTT